MEELAWIFKRTLADLIRWATTGPDQPRLFTLALIKEEDMKNVVEVTLPELKPGNPQKVNIRRFKYSEADLDGGNPVEVMNQDFPFDTGPFQVKMTQGKMGTLSLVDIDQVGNTSKDSTLTFEVKDEIPPDMPGAFNLKVLSEEDEATPPNP